MPDDSEQVTTHSRWAEVGPGEKWTSKASWDHNWGRGHEARCPQSVWTAVTPRGLCLSALRVCLGHLGSHLENGDN